MACCDQGTRTLSFSARNLYHGRPNVTYTVTTHPAIQAHSGRTFVREWRCALNQYGHSKHASALFGRFLCALRSPTFSLLQSVPSLHPFACLSSPYPRCLVRGFLFSLSVFRYLLAIVVRLCFPRRLQLLCNFVNPQPCLSTKCDWSSWTRQGNTPVNPENTRLAPVPSQCNFPCRQRSRHRFAYSRTSSKDKKNTEPFRTSHGVRVHSSTQRSFPSF